MVFRSASAGALRASFILAVVLSGAQACGGRSDMEEYSYGAGVPVTAAGRGGAGGAASVGGAAGTGATQGGRGGSSPGPTAGTTGIAGTFAVGGGGGAGLAGAAQGGTSTAGSPATGGAAGEPNGPTIQCGEASCDAETQTCCASGGLRCVPRGECQGAALGCTSNAECGDDLCCLSLTGDASAASSCKPQCSMGGSRDRQLCEVDDDCRAPFRFCTPTVFGVNICTRRP